MQRSSGDPDVTFNIFVLVHPGSQWDILKIVLWLPFLFRKINKRIGRIRKRTDIRTIRDMKRSHAGFRPKIDVVFVQKRGSHRQGYHGFALTIEADTSDMAEG